MPRPLLCDCNCLLTAGAIAATPTHARAGKPEFLALHWQTARTPRDYYPACQDRMGNTIKRQYGRFIDAEAPKALLLSDSPSADNPNQVRACVRASRACVAPCCADTQSLPRAATSDGGMRCTVFC